MRFRQFLEASYDDMRTTSEQRLAQLHAALQPYKKNISIMQQRELYLYRMHSGADLSYAPDEGELAWTIVPARAQQRKSLSGGNTLMYISSHWKDFPDRTKSYFATQNLSHVGDFSGYGANQEDLLVIPRDDVPVFGFTEEDFNFDETINTRSVPMKIITGMEEVYGSLRNLIDAAGSTALQTFVMDIASKHGFAVQQYAYAGMIPLEKIDDYISLVDDLYAGYQKVKEMIAADHLENNVKTATDKKRKAWDIGDRFYYNLHALRETVESAGFESLEEALLDITPETWGVKAFTSLKDVPAVHTDDNEIWWEGNFFGVSIAEAGANTTAAMILTQLKKIAK